MKIPGKVITKERVISVEVDKKALYRELLARYRKAYSSDLYLAEDYLEERTGKVMKYDGDNYHNGNPEYVVLRDITEKDRDAFKFKAILARILLNNEHTF